MTTYVQSYYQRNKHKYKDYYTNNAERIRANRKKRYAANPEVQKERSRRHKHGITSEQFDFMLMIQDYKCAACRTTKPKGKGNWHIDHCHETGHIRGLLCHYCNVALGNANDSIDRLQSLINYLRVTKP